MLLYKIYISHRLFSTVKDEGVGASIAIDGISQWCQKVLFNNWIKQIIFNTCKKNFSNSILIILSFIQIVVQTI